MSIVWDYINGIFTYDSKLYLKGGAFYWNHTDEFCRNLDSDDIDNLLKYAKSIGISVTFK